MSVSSSVIPTRESSATPFQRPCPRCTDSYPAAATSSAGNASWAILVSWSTTTSGSTDSSQESSLGNRAGREFTFQVAMRTTAILAPGDPVQGPGRTLGRSLSTK
jgi:hypothetical protein